MRSPTAIEAVTAAPPATFSHQGEPCGPASTLSTQPNAPRQVAPIATAHAHTTDRRTRPCSQRRSGLATVPALNCRRRRGLIRHARAREEQAMGAPTLVAAIATRGIEPANRETYSNGVRKATYRDADVNEIGFRGAGR
jgi:hypothetical protein